MSAVAFSTDEHWYFFSEFVRWETASGGPDPHLATLGEMVKDQEWPEAAWRAGCYAAGYNVPTAEVIWQQWPWDRVREERQLLPAWVKEYWPGFGLRRERRAVRTPEKFARCLLSYADWLEAQGSGFPDRQDFSAAWESLDQVWGMGRYVLLKLNEALSRYVGPWPAQCDLRAQGARSPRECLALLYPEHADWLLSGGDTLELTVRVETLANDVRERLATLYALEPSWFVTQVVLCEYRKCYEGKQYPGRTHDTELKYLRQTQAFWGNETEMLKARRALFPAANLGEIQGWSGAREVLSTTLPLYRYTWSDLKYDYARTRDPGEPALYPDGARCLALA